MSEVEEHTVIEVVDKKKLVADQKEFEGIPDCMRFQSFILS